MYRYTLHCKKCGYYEECATKDDWMAARSWHREKGCNLRPAPHKNGFIYTREKLAEEAWKGFEIEAEKAGADIQANFEKERDYDIKKIDPSNEWREGLPESREDTSRE